MDLAVLFEKKALLSTDVLSFVAGIIGKIPPNRFHNGALYLSLHTNDSQKLDAIKEKLSELGWYMAHCEADDPSGDLYNDQGLVILEPFVTERIIDLPDYLYHATLNSNLVSIYKKGLIPTVGKGVRTDAPRRIYVAPTIQILETVIAIMHRKFGKQHVSVLQINTSKLSERTEFFIDTQSDGYFTTTVIPPSAIELFELSAQSDGIFKKLKSKFRASVA